MYPRHVMDASGCRWLLTRPNGHKIDARKHTATSRMLLACLCSSQCSVSGVLTLLSLHFIILLGSEVRKKFCVTQTQRSKWCCLTWAHAARCWRVRAVGARWQGLSDARPTYLASVYCPDTGAQQRSPHLLQEVYEQISVGLAHYSSNLGTVCLC
jgi:hypothetical protein